jgi:CRP-like cAMP-binding protein
MAATKIHPTAFPKIEAACPELDEEQIEILARFAMAKEFKAGETLTAAGEQELKFFIVKSGQVEIRDGSSGELVTVLGQYAAAGEGSMAVQFVHQFFTASQKEMGMQPRATAWR